MVEGSTSPGEIFFSSAFGSLREHPVFSALVSPAEKIFFEGREATTGIRLRFAGYLFGRIVFVFFVLFCFYNILPVNY